MIVLPGSHLRARLGAGRPMSVAAPPVRRAAARPRSRTRAAAAETEPAAGAAPDSDAAAAQGGGGAAPAKAGGAAAKAEKKSNNALLSESLLSVSIAIVGDDAALNWAVCQALSKRIGWFPVSTSKVLCGMHKVDSIEQLVARDGADAVATYEADMLRGMRDQRRCCVATLGDGASKLPEIYTSLHASVVIWIDETDRRTPKLDSPRRALWAREAELPVRVQVPTGFAVKRRGADDKAREAAGPISRGLLQLLRGDPQLPARKLLYAELGFRGDWPNLQPAAWNPVMDRLAEGGAGVMSEEEADAAAAEAAVAAARLRQQEEDEAA
ncbi:MAG: hypothetical protein J3K34DRAFT_521273 [Monoraphidium minutum]|nr:MAG: hypothetical protein J3K34DRAFT_521273 [Monoraphidium minutum]